MIRSIQSHHTFKGEKLDSYGARKGLVSILPALFAEAGISRSNLGIAGYRKSKVKRSYAFVRPMQNLSFNKVKSRAANIIYGSILALSVLAVADTSMLTPWRMMVMVVITLVGVWAAKSYAYMIGGELAKGLRAKFSEMRGVFKENIWVLTPAIPLLGVFVLSAAGIISLKAALYLGQWLIIAFLFVTGFWLRRQTKGTFIMSVVDGLIDCSVGVLIVSLKFLLK